MSSDDRVKSVEDRLLDFMIDANHKIDVVDKRLSCIEGDVNVVETRLSILEDEVSLQRSRFWALIMIVLSEILVVGVRYFIS